MPHACPCRCETFHHIAILLLCFSTSTGKVPIRAAPAQARGIKGGDFKHDQASLALILPEHKSRLQHSLLVPAEQGTALWPQQGPPQVTALHELHRMVAGTAQKLSVGWSHSG